jgi:hypothetical protein
LVFVFVFVRASGRRFVVFGRRAVFAADFTFVLAVLAMMSSLCRGSILSAWRVSGQRTGATLFLWPARR